MGAQMLQPTAFAIFTRDRDQDYQWMLSIGPPQLQSDLHALHRDLLADQDAQTAAAFVLFDRGSRIGLVVANLKTLREDHMRTRITDTVLLEFESRDRKDVFRIAATLLAENADEIQAELLRYAEERFARRSEQPDAPLQSLTFPLRSPDSKAESPLTSERAAFRLNDENRKLVAHWLREIGDEADQRRSPTVVVCTGIVGVDSLSRSVGRSERFVALSRSRSLREVGPTPLPASAARERPLPWGKLGLGVLAVAIALGSAAAYLRRPSTNVDAATLQSLEAAACVGLMASNDSPWPKIVSAARYAQGRIKR